MSRPLAILFFVLTTVGCKIHRLPELPPERDPTDERAPIVPYRAPPDVLNTELSTGEGAPAGHEHHHGHAAPTTPATPDEAPVEHDGHDHGSPQP